MREKGLEAPGMVYLGDPEVLQRYPEFSGSGDVKACATPIYSWRERFYFAVPREVAGIHFPHYNVPAFLWRQRYVVTAHDVLQIKMEQAHAQRSGTWLNNLAVRKILEHGRLVLTGTHSVAEDLERLLSVSPEKIRIIPNAASDVFYRKPIKDVASFRERLELPERYALCIGVPQPYKNHRFLLEHFHHWSNSRQADLSLVLQLGKGPERDRLVFWAAEKGFTRNIMYTPYLQLAEVPLLYQGATMFIMPSLDEGFGIPVVEAQRMGIPVLSSGCSTLREVAGEGALFFDPRSPAEFYAQLDRMESDAELRLKLESRGLENEQRFSWCSSAEAATAAYNEAFG